MKKITVDILQKKLEQLKKIDGVSEISVRELAKESSVKPTEVMDIVDENPKLFFLTKIKDKKNLYIQSIFLSSKENPETQEWLDEKIKENTKTLEISHYNNYGHVSGYYIEPSKNKQLQYMNTEDKIDQIQKKFSLKKAGYSIGGYGDSSYYKVEKGYEISFEQLEILKNEGWTILGRYEKEHFYMG